MSTKDDGGPAFPVAEDHKVAADIPWTCGMSLRDYFIAHAPAEPQPWFEPVMPKMPPMFVTNVKEVRRDGRVLSVVVEEQNRAHDQWKEDRDKVRYTQWPVAWADEMLKERAK